MAKQPLTPEQRAVLADRLKQAREKKAALRAQTAEPTPPSAESSMSPEDVAALVRHVRELSARVAAFERQTGTTNQPQYNSQGRIVGTLERYVVNPKHYPDPRARLTAEPRLQRFAFPLNYELEWEVQTTSYETKDGLNMKEPRFILALHRIVMDEETGEPTNGRYVVCKMMFHEDPQAAIVVANENGLEIDESNSADFLNEMRYLRMRDWLFEAFYPPKPAQAKKNKKEIVVGNKLVEFFEVNSENSETIPFNELKTKF